MPIVYKNKFNDILEFSSFINKSIQILPKLTQTLDRNH